MTEINKDILHFVGAKANRMTLDVAPLPFERWMLRKFGTTLEADLFIFGKKRKVIVRRLFGKNYLVNVEDFE